MFMKVFGRKPVDAAPSAGRALHPTLVAELQRLDLLERGLAARAMDYVSTGTPSDLPARVKAAYQAARGNIHPFFDSAAQNEAAGAVELAFVQGWLPPGPELGRLVAIRVAYGRMSLPYGQALCDTGIRLLGLRGMMGQGMSRLASSAPGYRTPWERVMPLRDLWGHWREAGGTMADLFALVLPLSGSRPGEGESWGQSETFIGYAAAYPAALAEGLKAVEAGQRAGAIAVIEHHGWTGVPEVAAALVALLAKPFGRSDRDLAVSALARLEPARLLALLKERLPNADADTRHCLVEAAGRCGGEDMLAFLRTRAGGEKSAKVRAALDAILEVGTAERGAAEAEDEGYAAIDGTLVSLPPRKDLGTDEIVPPTGQDRATFDRLVIMAEEGRRNAEARYAGYKQAQGRSSTFQPYDAATFDRIYATVTTGAALAEGEPERLALHYIGNEPETLSWFAAFLDRQSMAVRLRLLPTNWFAPEWLLGGYVSPNRTAFLAMVAEWLAEDRFDLRDFLTPDTLRGLLQKSYDGSRLRQLEQLSSLPRAAVWPWLAEQQDVLDEGLGLRPASKPVCLHSLLDVLGLLPGVPQRYFPKLLDIALTEKKPLRRKAMALLKPARGLAARLEAMLDDKRQTVRINAAEWLADLRAAGSEQALRRRLKKERSDPVRAALIESLRRMDCDLSDVIGPATLIAEAEAAAAKSPPALPDWLDPAACPVLHFADGTTVPTPVVRHWLAQAIRLKDPAASGQFGIILDQLEPVGARTFSNWVLDAWIGYDTRVSSLEDATAWARANYRQHPSFSFYGPSFWTPAREAEAIAEIVRQRTTEPNNSGSDTKGMLALACRADPVFAANRVRWFLKKHGRRSNQAMALLEVLAGIGEPAALQVVIAASARLKQKSTQARAGEIASRYAEDRGWSVDELADRTVPSAGFDDEGVLELPCGTEGKVYTARLDARLAIHLFNPDGKPVKTLPAGDDEATGESRKAFAAAKKELAQVVALQATRLFEAMCAGRTWPVADWRMAFHEHPVMRRLIERLVWQEVDADGSPGALFRPTQEGDFTGAADEAVDVDRFAAVRLAHGTLCDAANAAAWQRHLSDYEVTPFLAQFDAVRAPLPADLAHAEGIADREGWKADSLTFRGVAEKRGYERVMRDGGGCNEYAKPFRSLGITATIFHTGSHAHDENNPVALKDLRFSRSGEHRSLPLGDVPPVLLAECQADYHAVAAKGAFDPEWKAIAPW